MSTRRYRYREAMVVHDGAVGVTFGYGKATREMVSFDIVKMVQGKVEWLKERGMGGSMFWEAAMDRRDEGSLIATSYEASGDVDESSYWVGCEGCVHDNVRGLSS